MRAVAGKGATRSCTVFGRGLRKTGRPGFPTTAWSVPLAFAFPAPALGGCESKTFGSTISHVLSPLRVVGGEVWLRGSVMFRDEVRERFEELKLEVKGKGLSKEKSENWVWNGMDWEFGVGWWMVLWG